MADQALNPKRFGTHQNAFGALRLLFASLVIVAHTPLLVDGTLTREILTRAFGTLTFGELAVDAFFLISGFLITGSYLSSRSVRSYFVKRIARIYPAFLVACLFCYALVVPLGGGAAPTTAATIAKAAMRSLLLLPPDTAAFAGTPAPAVNGAMWTVAYEFRCYVWIALLGLTPILRRRPAMLLLTAAIFVLAAMFPPPPTHDNTIVLVRAALAPGSHSPLGTAMFFLFGDPRQILYFLCPYMCGACFYLFRDHLRFSATNVLVACVGLIAGLSWSQFSAHVGVAIFGGFLILAVADTGGRGILGRINNRNDISYGVYLYGWPAEKLLHWWWPNLPLVPLGMATFAVACACGWASWIAVERPIMARIRPPAGGRPGKAPA